MSTPPVPAAGGRPAPKFILRGHLSAVHAATFFRGNDRLLTGDADGRVISWDLCTMRACANWKAHDGPILGIGGWGSDKIITHGRDYNLIVWKVDVDEEEPTLSSAPSRPVHRRTDKVTKIDLLRVNTMNFCSFASCPAREDPRDIIVAVPNALVSDSIDIIHLPSSKRVHTVASGDNLGMAMCLALFYDACGHLTLISGFESGLAKVSRMDAASGNWTDTYRVRVHTQPILSLDVAPDREFFLTSGADAVVAKHPVPQPRQPVPPTPPAKSGAAGEPGPEAIVREPELCTEPVKVSNTKHAGQQSLRIRSDARIFATAGWDSALRVYSTSTLKELAVLQWHEEGCYAACFSPVQEQVREREPTGSHAGGEGIGGEERVPIDVKGGAGELTTTSVKNRRIGLAKSAHWIVAGSKDGKVSLWDIY